MSSAVELFAELFRGSRSAYGVHIPEKEKIEGEKAKGKSFVKNESLTFELYNGHANGIQSIGVIPIDENNNIRFMAIDVDVYPLDPKRYCALIDKYKLPMTPFRSKSGGLHLYCFFSLDISAGKALDFLHILRHLLLISKETETFPKQRRVTARGKGNFINLPYFGGEATDRYAYSPEGKQLGFKEAMNWCYNRRTTLKGLEAAINALPMSSAPPCLQALLMNNEVSVTARNRNIFLFNSAVYLKARWKDEFPERLLRVNDELDRPLEEQELESTVISSHQRGSYSYQCEDPSLSLHCDKEICKHREYGKGSGTISNFAFERLIQVKSSPPYYKWMVNGVEMVFYSESELRAQDRFMDLCMRHLHRLPNKLKADAWTDILNSALQEMEFEEIKQYEDLSTFSIWFIFLKEFLTERAAAQTPGQVKTGLVYKDKDGYYFRVEDFVQWLENTKRFKAFTLPQTHYQLKKMGIGPKKLYDPRAKKAFRTWHCEENIIETLEDYAVEQQFEASPPPQVVTEAKEKKIGANGVARLKELLDDLPDDATLDFAHLQEKEKF